MAFNQRKDTEAIRKYKDKEEPFAKLLYAMASNPQSSAMVRLPNGDQVRPTAPTTAKTSIRRINEALGIKILKAMFQFNANTIFYDAKTMYRYLYLSNDGYSPFKFINSDNSEQSKIKENEFAELALSFFKLLAALSLVPSEELPEHLSKIKKHSSEISLIEFREPIKENVEAAQTQAEKDHLAELLSNLDSTRASIPDDFLMLNDRATNIITNDDFIIQPVREGGTITRVGVEIAYKDQQRKLDAITTFISLIYDPDTISEMVLPNGITFDYTDRIIYNAISTMWECGQTIFTVDMLYRTINGYTETEKVSEAAQKQINDRVQKMEKIKALIDYSQWIAYKTGKPQDTMRTTTRILTVETAQFFINGNLSYGYKILSEPKLLQYNKQVGNRIVQIPMNVLNTKEIMQSTDRNRIIKAYLLQNIGAMKNPKSKLSNRILLETLYKKCRLTATSRTQRSRDRNTIEGLLSHWREQGFIIDYIAVMENKKQIRGYDIIYQTTGKQQKQIAAPQP